MPGTAAGWYGDHPPLFPFISGTAWDNTFMRWTARSCDSADGMGLQAAGEPHPAGDPLPFRCCKSGELTFGVPHSCNPYGESLL